MNAILHSPNPRGSIAAIPSKSAAHRMLIAAALADAPTQIICPRINDDISATLSCLTAFGAKIEKCNDIFTITPISQVPNSIVCDAGESGSTLRFLIPVAASFGIDTTFICHGRLIERPLGALVDTLACHGVTVNSDGKEKITVSGKLLSGEYEIPGNISSQFVTGLCFALAKIPGESVLRVTGKIESYPYIEMTAETLCSFGVTPDFGRDGCLVIAFHGTPFRTKGTYRVEGDCSNAAFFMAAGAVGSSPVTVTGLNPDTKQGDYRFTDICRAFGAGVTVTGDSVTVYPAKLHAVDYDCSDTPDLLPIIAVLAAVAEGETRLYGGTRVRLKESDRIKTTAEMLVALGVSAFETEDGLLITGGKLLGGTVSAAGDHRIAMAASIAAIPAIGTVTVTHAEAVNKSYPAFFDDFRSLLTEEERMKRICLSHSETA